MAFTIAKKPELDINGERWVEFAPGAEILVGSIANPLYKSHQALINRHLAAINQQARVGTAEFNLADLPDVELETDDDLFVELVAKHLIKDWKGVDVEEKPGEPAPYSAELCIALINQMPSVYFLALRTATDIARRVEEKAAATAEKQ
ncbi:hypothetical protein HMPREF3173_01825 [Pseudomonas sp. HMSC08G10]|uniref:hypothetical protein n=1 Tax=Pseudomonas sp. HMSC08G10 TaxID=1581141 RepID=UPI0008A6107F|nr:hypothetical protein [Pseudomonas sp. HMSC08G10]OFS77153.1 hypothetical protein HMPREF3173_01825 [Pseudomonas sp. HMSC08G10]